MCLASFRGGRSRQPRRGDTQVAGGVSPPDGATTTPSPGGAAERRRAPPERKTRIREGDSRNGHKNATCALRSRGRRPVRRTVDAAQRRRLATGFSPSSRPSAPIGFRWVRALWPRCAEPSALRARNVVGAPIPGARAAGCVTPLRGAARSFGPHDDGQRPTARGAKHIPRYCGRDLSRQAALRAAGRGTRIMQVPAECLLMSSHAPRVLLARRSVEPPPACGGIEGGAVGPALRNGRDPTPALPAGGAGARLTAPHPWLVAPPDGRDGTRETLPPNASHHSARDCGEIWLQYVHA